MKAWGHNADRELGLGNATSPILTATDMPTNFTKVQGCHNELSAIGLLSDGTVWSWGQANRGTLGDGNSTSSWISAFHDPTQVPSLSGIVDIEAGSGGSMFAIDSSGNLHAWGFNFDGELGLGDNTTPHFSHSITATNVAKVFSGPDATYLLKTDGTLQSTGGGVWGQQGTGAVGGRNTWGTIVPASGKTVAGVATANQVVWVLMTDGSVYGVGRSDEGQLGFVSGAANTPRAVLGTAMDQMASTSFAACFSRWSDNTAWSIGANEG